MLEVIKPAGRFIQCNDVVEAVRPGELIVVDYLQLMNSAHPEQDRASKMSGISQAMKALVEELNVPVIAVSQLNRSLEQRINKRPVISDLLDLGTLEQDADVILFMYQNQAYHSDTPNTGTVEIIIAKNRNGPIGTCNQATPNGYAWQPCSTTGHRNAGTSATRTTRVVTSRR